MRVYNTMSRRKEEFKPVYGNEVRMYHCGPTVYDYAHIGNFRAYVFADVLRRYVEFSGYRVKQVMNITDVGHMTTDADEGEDKMEVGSRRERVSPWELAEKYMQAFFEDRDRLNIKPAHVYPRATEHIPHMIDMISALIEKGHAYVSGGCVYYDVTTFPRYGMLSGNTLESLEAGKRIEINTHKRNPWDFALWITDPKHVMKWDSPWGEGYPGWHIECSAMSSHYLGVPFDIHTGGEDNIFPHHECEIAQTEGATGETFVKYWMHTRFLQVEGRKMSKSLGNFYTLRDLLEMGHDPLDVRYALLSTNYRQPLNFTFQGLEAARTARARLCDFVEHLRMRSNVSGERSELVVNLIAKAESSFRDAMDDDLNMSKALAGLFDFMREVNKVNPVGAAAAEVVKFMERVDGVLGVIPSGGEELPREVLALVEKREEARKARDFATADAIRDQVAAMGYVIEDTPQGPICRKAR